jgi:hypothetical protein
MVALMARWQSSLLRLRQWFCFVFPSNKKIAPHVQTMTMVLGLICLFAPNLVIFPPSEP